MAGIKSESVAAFIPESVADFLRNQRTALGLKALPPAQRVEKCYMKELGSCVPPISGEHIISDSVCQVLMGGGEFSISGVPWLEAGEVKIIAPLQAKCLCTKHNSALSDLDAAAHHFFSSLKSYLERDAGPRHALISGTTSSAGY
jgi:hypothetical protein